MSFDFSLSRYGSICQTVISLGYRFLTIAEYINNTQDINSLVMMRHDVDRYPENALWMARLENELGFCSTYYFRHTTNAFKPEIIRQISRLGHEIGYHYETLSKVRGDMTKAIRLFEQELDEFRSLTDVQTISMHGSPLSPFNNCDLWREYDFHEYALIGEAYISIDYAKIQYFTDTGRSWGGTLFNIRDHTLQLKSDDKINSTADLITIIREKRYPNICISTHPERWPRNLTGWLYSFSFDMLANAVKLALRSITGKRLA